MHTDANAIAGQLEEIFARDMTSVEHVCHSCRSLRYVGGHRLYRGAGLVLRCPVCGDVAASIAALADGYAVNMRGTWLMPVPAGVASSA